MESKQEIVRVLRQTGKDKQTQCIPFTISGVPLAVGDGKQKDGRGDTSNVVGTSLDHKEKWDCVCGVREKNHLQGHGQGPDIGKVVPQHRHQRREF